MYPESFLTDLNARLSSKAEAVCAELLKGGKRKGGSWSCGGVDGGPGKSMDVELVGDKAGVWHDRATGESGRLLKLWQTNRGLSFQQAVEEAAAFVRMSLPNKEEPDSKPLDLNNYTFSPPPVLKAVPEEPLQDAPPPFVEVTAKPFDWRACVAATTDDHLQQLSEWRGYSIEFCRWLRETEMIGVWRGAFALPVHDNEGKVSCCHYRLENGWAYFPKDKEKTPLHIGLYEHASYALVLESQWDAFALLDRLGHHEEPTTLAAIITRGAQTNVDFQDLHIPKMIVVPQNDPISKASKTTGRTPAQEWLHRIQESRSIYSEFMVAAVPDEHKDANDWLKAEPKLTKEELWSRIIDRAENPALRDVYRLADLLDHQVQDDPDSLIGHQRRFLSKGGTWVLIGPSGIGKSTLTSSIAMHFAMGVSWNGISVRRPLRTLVVQAENDRGDLSEMYSGALVAGRKQFEESQLAKLKTNLRFVQVTDKVGEDFTRYLESLIRETKAEFVLVDPLLSYVGDDLMQQKVASTFLRKWLLPVMQRTGAIILLIHHTGKPPKDVKAMRNWSESDFSYLGLGSSELTNWARAVSVIVPTEIPGTFCFKMTKRGERSGLLDQFKNTTAKEIHICWGNAGEGQVWKQTKYEPEEEEGKSSGRKTATKAPDLQDIVKQVASCTTYDALLGVICEVGKLSKRDAGEAVKRMMRLGLITKGADGYYRKES